jgi:hypothetical protein
MKIPSPADQKDAAGAARKKILIFDRYVRKGRWIGDPAGSLFAGRKMPAESIGRGAKSGFVALRIS